MQFKTYDIIILVCQIHPILALHISDNELFFIGVIVVKYFAV
jgi:hypothetical protein